MASKKKTAGKRSAGAKKKNEAQRPVRREVCGAVCLLLSACVAASYFKTEAIAINAIRSFCCGVFGCGYYVVLPALLLAALVLFFHHGRPIALRLTGALTVPLWIGTMVHILACEETFETLGGVRALWQSGTALTSGGVLSGGLGILMRLLFGKVVSMIFLTAALLSGVILALRLSPKRIAALLREHERAPYEPEEEAEQPAPHPANRMIDIPLDSERKEEEKKSGFFRHKPDSVRTPDELLREPEETEETAAGEESKKLPVPEPLPLVSESGKASAADVQNAAAEVAQEIETAVEKETPEYCYPPITLLNEGGVNNASAAGAELRSNSRRLAETLKSFGVDAKAGDVVRGPSVTRYEFILDQGVKLSKITGLADDIALALGASGVRIAPIPDKISVVGIEVPNRLVSTVCIRDVLESREFTQHRSASAFAVGKDISGRCIIGNVAKLPHVLIAGTTGSGKSVCTNSLIVSMLYKSTPEEVRFIMVDPKMVELAPYNGIPHLLIPVVTDPKKAAGALQWAVYEMMKRYKIFSENNIKDLESYNRLAAASEELKTMPTVVIVIDELADLMIAAAKEVEESICRVAQMGRAAGMHLVIATQRPSADVITGLMKANIPSRIAFAVASSLESRIILDNSGAEKLVGRGDMLYAPLGEGKPARVQGCFISPEEIERVVSFVKENGTADYSEEVIRKIEENVAEREKSGKNAAPAEPDAAEESEWDELLPAAVEVVLETGQASVSMLQRRLKLGYARAARIVDEMEERGYVGGFEGSKPRQLLITKEQWEELKMKNASAEAEV